MYPDVSYEFLAFILKEQVDCLVHLARESEGCLPKEETSHLILLESLLIIVFSVFETHCLVLTTLQSSSYVIIFSFYLLYVLKFGFNKNIMIKQFSKIQYIACSVGTLRCSCLRASTFLHFRDVQTFIT